jgi:hypothetical protein
MLAPLNPWVSLGFLLTIALLVLSLALLFYCVFTIGRKYSFFRPFRVLLLWIMLEVAWYVCIDAWSFLAAADMTRAQILGMFLVSQGLLILQVWVFAWLWLRALRALTRPHEDVQIPT